VKPGPIGAGKLGDFKKGDRWEIGKKGSLGRSAGIFFFECRACRVCKFLLREFSVLML
jgi:hypothetical protein